MKIQESAEDYLEAILVLQNQHGYARSIDIAQMLNFSRPSISRAVKRLKEHDYIHIEDNNCIFLTAKGRDIAQEVFYRHQLLTNYLLGLGVSLETAKADACRIEHVISQETCDKIAIHYQKMAASDSNLPVFSYDPTN